MKLIITVFFLFFSIGLIHGQEIPKAALFDEFDRACSEYVMAKYDAFAIALQNDPSADGYFVLYGDEKAEGRNIAYLEWLLKYGIRSRGLDKDRLKIIRGKNRTKELTQFWLVPQGATPPVPETEFVSPAVDKTTLFDTAPADFFRDYDGKIKIYSNGFYDLGCDFVPNTEEYTKILKSNPGLTAVLIVYNKTRQRSLKVANFAVNQLIKDHKIPRNRIKTIFGGKRAEPEIEFWLVLKGEKMPKPTRSAK